MIDMDLTYFLDKVDEHSQGYDILTRPLMAIFKSYILGVLEDPNTQADRCSSIGGDWYIALLYGESPQLTAENMASYLQDGGNVQDFADAVISGRRS